FLLPNYDEYLIAYKDRGLMLPPGAAPRGGIAGLNAFEHPLVVDGVLAGYWTRRVSGTTTRIELKPWKPLNPIAARAVKAATAAPSTAVSPAITSTTSRSVCWNRSVFLPVPPSCSSSLRPRYGGEIA